MTVNRLRDRTVVITGARAYRGQWDPILGSH